VFGGGGVYFVQEMFGVVLFGVTSSGDIVSSPGDSFFFLVIVCFFCDYFFGQILLFVVSSCLLDCGQHLGFWGGVGSDFNGIKSVAVCGWGRGVFVFFGRGWVVTVWTWWVWYSFFFPVKWGGKGGGFLWVHISSGWMFWGFGCLGGVSETEGVFFCAPGRWWWSMEGKGCFLWFCVCFLWFWVVKHGVDYVTKVTTTCNPILTLGNTTKKRKGGV